MFVEQFTEAIEKMIEKGEKLSVYSIAKEMKYSKELVRIRIQEEIGTTPKHLMDTIMEGHVLDGIEKGETLTNISTRLGRRPETVGRLYKRKTGGEGFRFSKNNYKKGKNGGYFDSYMWKALLEKVDYAMPFFLLAAFSALLLGLIPSLSTIRLGLVIMFVIVFLSVFPGCISVILDIPFYVREIDGAEQRYKLYWAYIKKLMVLVLLEFAMCSSLLLHVHLQ